jgi:DNA-binding NtrC family response regulator
MKKTVLVVDDDASVRDSMKKVLESAGFEVLLAGDGQEAVEQARPGQIDLLLLDIGLPIRNGWDAFARITAANPCLPIIIITGHSDQYPVASAAGASAFMEKPLDASQLLSTIQKLLAEPKEERLRRLSGRTGKSRYAGADAGPLFEKLRAGWSAPRPWELRTNCRKPPAKSSKWH